MAPPCIFKSHLTCLYTSSCTSCRDSCFLGSTLNQPCRLALHGSLSLSLNLLVNELSLQLHSSVDSCSWSTRIWFISYTALRSLPTLCPRTICCKRVATPFRLLLLFDLSTHRHSLTYNTNIFRGQVNICLARCLARFAESSQYCHI